MKAMILSFAATIAIAFIADAILNQAGFSTSEVHTGAAVRNK